MRVSIVTAVRNGAATIADTLESVIEQDHPCIEHIVIDGASTDGTLDIVRQHGRRVAVVRTAPDSGVYDAFNKGLAAASGDVIAFLNAGDTYTHRGVVSRLMSEFADPSLDLVFGDLVITAESDRSHVVRHYRCGDFSPARLAGGFMPAHPTFFARRSVYQRVGRYDPSFRIAGDFELCVRVFSQGAVHFRHVPEVLVRMSDGGMSNRGLASVITVTREMHRACLRHGVETSWLRLMMRLPAKFWSGITGDR